MPGVPPKAAAGVPSKNTCSTLYSACSGEIPLVHPPFVVQPSTAASIEKDVLNCAPPRIWAEGGFSSAVRCDRNLTLPTPRLVSGAKGAPIAH